MLINIRISELQSNTSNSIPLTIAIAISFNYPMFQLLPYNIAILNNYYNLNNIYNISFNQDNQKVGLNTYNDDIHFVTSKIWDGAMIENSDISSVGNVMYTSYNAWLILASLVLLLAMVGAIVITVKQPDNGSSSYAGSNASYLGNKRNGGVRVNKFSTQALVRNSRIAFDGSRAYSISLTSENIKDKGNSFYEWLGGFTDAEGTFYFKKQNNLYYVFIYQIALHVDDIDVLARIKDFLVLGKITINKSVCGYTINKQEEIKEIIKILLNIL